MALRYSGEFMDISGNRWGVNIFSKDWIGQPGELTFPGSSPLIISWEETDKIAPIQGSTATLTIESPGDRTYIDLYTIESGSITLDVTRNGSLYWRGFLDPEFYEEPYEKASNYDVQLTFSDFGILDRLNFEGQGILSLDSIIKSALASSGLNDSYSLLCSTQLYQSPLTLNRIYISSENFYDEDGEPMTLRETIEAILQPLALRMIQRGGVITIYDLNALFLKATNGSIYWTGDRQTLSADIVINNAKVTFSPYNKYDLYDGDFNSQDVNIIKSYTYFNTQSTDDPYVSFSASLCSARNLKFSHGTAQLFRMRSIRGGSDASGVICAMPTARHQTVILGDIKYAYPKDVNEPIACDVVLRTTAPVRLRKVSDYSDNRGNKYDSGFFLKISLDALIDVRYNPFETADEDNEKTNWDKYFRKLTYGYIPGSLVVKDDNGNILCHFNNRDRLIQDYPSDRFVGWREGAPARPDTFMFVYYDNNISEDTPCWGGWKTNRPQRHYDGEGDIIPLPNVTGTLELSVYGGIFCRNVKKAMLYAGEGVTQATPYKGIQWFLLKPPTIEVVNSFGKSLDDKDIEYKAWINRSAKEGRDIETTCGVGDSLLPCSRGVFLDNSYSQITTLSRAGINDVLEKLLIGTIYSNYNTRHVKLSGECSIIPGTLPVISEDNQTPGKKFMIAGETQDCAMDSSDAVFVEVLEDSFQGIDYE